ncbi:MAG: exonuclease domain-containing protein [Microbacteriaceae bacterium]
MTTPWHEYLGVFDLETTGVDVESCRIVTAHVGVIDARGVVLESNAWIADPGVEIPAGASAVHGITTDVARSTGRPAAEVVGEVVHALRTLIERGIPITIYNAPYDLTLLNREAVRHNVEPLQLPFAVIDPLVIDKGVDRYRKGKRTLVAAAEHYGVELSEAHDAGADAVAAGRVAQALIAKYPEQLAIDVNDLQVHQAKWSAEQAASFQEYMRRTRDPNFTSSGDWPIR